MRLRHAAVAAVVVLPAAPAEAHDGCNTRSCSERVARKQCSRSRPVPCIRRAALHWHVDTKTLVRKARCESRLQWWASNGAHVGLFQFRVAYPSTWATTPYAGESPYSVKWSSLAAAWMHRVGRGGEWACR